MVASNPMDVAKDQARQRSDETSAAGSPASPSTQASLRPRLPAERDINNAMNGFNAGVVNFLKSEQKKVINLGTKFMEFSLGPPFERQARSAVRKHHENNCA